MKGAAASSHRTAGRFQFHLDYMEDRMIVTSSSLDDAHDSLHLLPHSGTQHVTGFLNLGAVLLPDIRDLCGAM